MAENENPLPPPDGFREFGATDGPPHQRQPAIPPAGYPAQPPMGSPASGVPGSTWQPGVMPPPVGGIQSGSGQPQGFIPVQSPPPRRNSPVLIIALAGLALVVIIVPLVLLALSRGPSPIVSNPQTTATSGPAATPTSQGAVFKPDGTAPTSEQCESRIGVPCYSPEQIQQAFNLNPLYRQGYDGKGQTIVVIGAGHSANVENDLKAFDKAWGLPDPPSFKIIQPFGPPVDYDCNGGGDGLEIENTLDVEWSHAIAPGANIILLIGPNTERTYFPVPEDAPHCALYDLEEAVAYALDNHLGNIITISYGGSELGGRNDTATDKANIKKEFNAANAIFKRAANMGVTVLASAGDSGVTNPNDYKDPSKFWDKPNVSWPASDPYVLAIGGTTLQIKDASGTYGSEKVWAGTGNGATGGGLSAFFEEPAYQKTAPDQTLFQGKRGMPDVAFPADVNYALYATADFGSIGPSWPHWTVIGGTSASAPCWAGLVAIANQMSAEAGGKSLGFIHPALYSLQGEGMHDITQGNNSYVGVTGYRAQSGYDLVTGWGTPIADQLLPALIEAVQQVGNTP